MSVSNSVRGPNPYGYRLDGNDLAGSIYAYKAQQSEINRDLHDKDAIEARIWGLYRNNDVMRGLVEKLVDAIVGPRVRLQAMPDWEALGVTQEEAQAWAKEAERKFHLYADSPENWISAKRDMDLTQMVRQIARNLIMTGEGWASREWRRSPIGFEGFTGPDGETTRYLNTCFNVFSGNRVRTPTSKTGAGDSKIFHGIEFNPVGEAVAYHIRQADPRQRRNFGNKEYKRVTKYTRFGWHQLIHVFEPFNPEFPRGVSRLAAVLMKLDCLDRYLEADLMKNLIAAAFVMVFTSDADPEEIADALSGAQAYMDKAAFQLDDDDSTSLPADVAAARQEHLDRLYKRFEAEVEGGHNVHLTKGEALEIVQAPNAGQTSASYKEGHQRDIANGAGISFELGMGNFQGISFSGGQMSLGIFEHSANIIRKLYVHKFAKLVFRSWLDEAMDKGILPRLGGRDYFPNKEAYARCEFTGARRIHVDPVKKANANRIELANGTTSRTDIANENGTDLEAIINNRANEAVMMLEALEAAASRRGIDISDGTKKKFLIDVVGTEAVDVVDTQVQETPNNET